MTTEVETEERGLVVAAPNLLSVTPADMLRNAYAAAVPLAKVIDGAHLAVNISGRKFVKVEGWTALGSMMGVFPVVVSTHTVTHQAWDPNGERIEEVWGWEATVEARTLAGATVGRAEAMCTRDEHSWSGRPQYALRAMAQTRATSRALRGPLGFIVALAGYEATAAEEMPGDPDAGK